MTNSPLVLSAQDGALFWVTLNQPHKHNILSKELIEQLNQCIDYAQRNSEIKVILLQAEGRSFCAGADLRECEGASLENDFITPWQRLSYCTKPVIALTHGVVYGGGFEIALMCDVILAAENTKFAFPEIQLGLLPGGGGTQRLQRLLGYHRAAYMCLTGEILKAETLHQWGVIQHISTQEDLHDYGHKIASQMSVHSLSALEQIKSVLRYGMDAPLEPGLDFERAAFYSLLHGSEAQRKIDSFINKNNG